jgi:hypothetical protein
VQDRLEQEAADKRYWLARYPGLAYHDPRFAEYQPVIVDGSIPPDIRPPRVITIGHGKYYTPKRSVIMRRRLRKRREYRKKRIASLKSAYEWVKERERAREAAAIAAALRAERQRLAEIEAYHGRLVRPDLSGFEDTSDPRDFSGYTPERKMRRSIEPRNLLLDMEDL